MSIFGTGTFSNRGGVAQKRRVFFSFNYDDIMRVNNVRNIWKIAHPHSQQNRSFYDSSLWERSKLNDDDQIKNLIREGVMYTSAVCVLVGSTTWQRRWVKYEIARSVVDQRGLLAVHLNSINHHERRSPDERGFNPIKLMGIAKRQNGSFYLCEWMRKADNWSWAWYEDYVQAITIPKWVSEPKLNEPLNLSSYTREYDFALQNGATNIGGWVDLAAIEAGR